MEEKMLTLAQVADRLQVSEKTIYRYVEAKELKGVKIGRVWRFYEEDIKKFLDARTNIK